MNQDRWRIEGSGIVWDVANDARLPHEDHIEMSGRKVSVIVRYSMDENRRLTLSREVIWPMLRTTEGDVRGYLRRTYDDERRLSLFLNDALLELPPVQEIGFDGVLTFAYPPVGGLAITRSLSPSVHAPTVIEEWRLVNVSSHVLHIATRPTHELPGMQDKEDSGEESVSGVYGEYFIWTGSSLHRTHEILPGHAAAIYHFFTARRKMESPPFFPSSAPTVAQIRASTNPLTKAMARINSLLARDFNGEAEVKERRFLTDRIVRGKERVDQTRVTVHLQTPDPILNAAFAFTKLRAAESLFETKMGLVHSPGGGRYYGGIWNNDQCEYSGPFFGYLGDPDAKRAALTAYRNFAPYMTPEYKPIPTSLEMEGTIEIHAGGDRGDAAMYAGGAARFALATGDQAIAEELYPHIAWCLEYCRRRTNAQGVVESDTDELEGRFPTGTANLSTSCLAYDACRRAADLARSLNKPDDATEYDQRADALEAAIESYFGAMIEGYETYRYYDGNEILRAWICLPLALGIGCWVLGVRCWDGFGV